MEHSQWELAQPASIDNPIAGRFGETKSTESAAAKSYCKVTIRMGVHRRHEFMQWNFLFPAFLLGGSALMQWSIPIEAADARIGLGFSLVLALVALKLGIVPFLPTVSYLTFLDKYMIRHTATRTRLGTCSVAALRASLRTTLPIRACALSCLPTCAARMSLSSPSLWRQAS